MGRPKKRIRQYDEHFDNDKYKKVLDNLDKFREVFEVEARLKKRYEKQNENLSEILKTYKVLENNLFTKGMMAFTQLLGMGFTPREIGLMGIYNRYEINPLQSVLTPLQIVMLLPYFNDYVFNDPIGLKEFEDIFKGGAEPKTYVAKNIGNISFIFSALSDNGYICPDWKNELYRMRLFKSKNNKFLTPHDYAQSLSNIKDHGGSYEIQERIPQMIANLKSVQ